MEKSVVQSKIQEVHDQMLGTNWGDYLDLVQNEVFWTAELEVLDKVIKTDAKDPETMKKWDYLQKATDCMYACEDVRDHINELLELSTRKTGILGMGLAAPVDDIENMSEQAEMLTNRYQDLLKEYPDFKPKIEQSVGHGLALLRMKHKFAFPGGHRFFY